MSNLTPKDFSNTLTGYAESKMPQIISLVGDQKKAEKFKADLALMSLDAGLVKCTPMSVFTTALKVAQVGLSIVKERKQAYLVPFKNKGIDEAQLQISYIGWQILAKRAGYEIDCELVYKCDDFDYVVDENGKSFKFKANLAERMDDKRQWVEENLVGAMVWSKDIVIGSLKRDFIGAKQLFKLRANSPAIKYNKFSAWDDFTVEMFKAKAIKSVASKLPTDNEALMIAASADSEVEKKIYKEKLEEVKVLDLNAILNEPIDVEA